MFISGRESYGRKFYQPNRILVVVRERLDEEAIKAPFTSLLTENVINVSKFVHSVLETIKKEASKFEVLNNFSS